MEKISFISTKTIVNLNKYKPLDSDLKLIVNCSSEYIRWVLGFNDNQCNDSKEIEYRTQLKWSLLRCFSIEIINFAIFCNDIFNSDIPIPNTSTISYKNYKTKNLNKAIQFFKNKISVNNWGVNEDILNIFLEIKTQ
eukprot:jgi/Orpsp1_1/1180602/evm.model.c7180000074072.1